MPDMNAVQIVRVIRQQWSSLSACGYDSMDVAVDPPQMPTALPELRSSGWSELLFAPYLRQREGGRIVSVAAIIAVAVDGEGRREIVGLHIGHRKPRHSGARSSRAWSSVVCRASSW